jgi:asparagine synthase (glutamine-hydrolysing)
MCGLAGEIACGSGSRSDADRALPMLQAILHRGPDDVGLWEDERGDACLLHARLALVDLAGGRQPMADAGGNVVIAFNGEIYGFERARRELEARGAIFRTRSDTEVLLQLYLQNGPDFVRDLEGEFAFALFDRRNGQAMLARDRFGVKPLMIASYRGLLLFGSEAKAILAHPWSERRLDMTTLNRRLDGVFLPQDTLFAGISAVEPGTYMLVSRQGITTRRYADLDPEAAGTARLSFDEAVEALEPLLTDAVRKRFHGDAPVGVFLSGGIDSSTVAAFAGAAPRPAAAGDLSTYSIDFVGSPESERAAATETARRLSLRGVHQEVAVADLEAAFEASVWHAETLAPNAHGTAKMLLARRAKHDVKAVLTGEGADELHGGYAYFEHAALLAAAAAGDEPQAKDALSRFVEKHGPRDGVFGAITPKLRQELAWSRSGGTPYSAMRARVGGRGSRLLRTADSRRQAQEDPARALLDWLSLRAPGARVLDDVTLSRFVSLQTDLPAYNLSSLGDRIEMASGLEGRLPYLDRGVVDLLWRLPPAFHQANGENKRVLRAVLARRLPHLAMKPKHAFLTPTTPSCDLLLGHLAERWLSRDTVRRVGIFKPSVLAAARLLLPACRRHRSLAFYASAYLTMALSVHLIVEMFCERFPETLARRSPLSLAELRQQLGRHAAPRLAVA